ncbi:MAG: Vms1/Ankzf1 family peptidyl-tRNA hydrolase [Gaiellaceae bacterium]
MSATITWEMLRELAGFRAAQGSAVSLYLSLDPSVAPTAGETETRFNSLLAEGERIVDARKDELTRDCREALKIDFERLRTWFDDGFDRDGSRGVAVFASGLDDLWATVGVPELVEDGIKVDRELFLVPLVRLVGSGAGVLLASVGREQGQVFRLEGGRLVEVADESDEVPGRHDQGGWSQARYERHIENLVGQHLRRVAETLERYVRRERGVRVVLAGAEDIRSDFESVLSNDVKECLVGWTHARAHASPSELLEAAEPVLHEWRAGREDQLLERWREEAGRRGRASAGWQHTLEAASDGRVELLLVQEGADRPAYRCPKCGRAQTSNGSCPLDGAEVEERDGGLDLAVHQTLAHGGTVTVIRDHQDLEPVEGIGALLRF